MLRKVDKLVLGRAKERHETVSVMTSQTALHSSFLRVFPLCKAVCITISR